jgi:hypothetical protein
MSGRKGRRAPVSRLSFQASMKKYWILYLMLLPGFLSALPKAAKLLTLFAHSLVANNYV